VPDLTVKLYSSWP